MSFASASPALSVAAAPPQQLPIKEVTVTNSGNKTKAEVLQIANECFAFVEQLLRATGVTADSPPEQLQLVHNRVFERYRDFYGSYPTVVKHMVFDGAYRPAAFAEYLTWLETHPWLNDKQRMRAYAYYACCLYKQHFKTPAEVRAFRKQYLVGLEAEHREFLEAAERAKARVLADEEQMASRHLDYLLSLCTPALIPDDDRRALVVERARSGALSLKEFETLVYKLKQLSLGEPLGNLLSGSPATLSSGPPRND